MRERINRLAKGIVDAELPSCSFRRKKQRRFWEAEPSTKENYILPAKIIFILRAWPILTTAG